MTADVVLTADAAARTRAYRDLVVPSERSRFATRRLPKEAWDTLAALFLGLVTAQSLASRPPLAGQRTADAVGYVLVVGLCVPMVLHRRFPRSSVLLALASLAVFAARSYAAFPGVPVFLLVLVLAANDDRRTSVGAAALTEVVFVFALLSQPDGVADGSTWVATALAVVVAWFIGDALRNRRLRWDALEERARWMEAEREERARQAVAEERLRIARELHDVVAHSMSVIAVQSGVGHHVMTEQPEEARKALAVIEATSRGALVEMRRLLGVLRSEDDPSGELAPAPGLADLGALASELESAGLPVHVHVEGEPVEVPSGVDLSAYRIVQEALTNVLKHSRHAAARVSIRYGVGEVSVEVHDNGIARADEVSSSPGHGLIGMRERVAVFGGDFEAGSLPAGGFGVSARLPYGPGR